MQLSHFNAIEKKVDENFDSLHIIVLCNENCQSENNNNNNNSYLFSVFLVVLIIPHLSQ